MAEEVTIGGSGTLFVGEDKVIELELYSASDPTIAIDHSAWTEVFDVRKKDTSVDPAILSVVPAVSGVYNPLRSANLQRALVTLTDDQLNLFKEQNYRWSWKRMDAGSETVLAWGTFAPQKATAP